MRHSRKKLKIQACYFFVVLGIFLPRRGKSCVLATAFGFYKVLLFLQHFIKLLLGINSVYDYFI